jgi:hypothetical protein
MSDRYVIAQENNVLRVNFERSTDPPNPQFPSAGALRSACAWQVDAALRWQITSAPRGKLVVSRR